ncbi:MAG: cell division protein CrgA [Actinomycetota bacterium]|nr:cell division protein CrgA [Actinomycetota bacterium]
MPKSRSKRKTTQPPPKPKPKQSPAWVGILFFILLGLGVLLIIVNYLGLLPGGTQSIWLFAGLGSMAAAFILATQWH